MQINPKINILKQFVEMAWKTHLGMYKLSGPVKILIGSANITEFVLRFWHWAEYKYEIKLYDLLKQLPTIFLINKS